MKSDSKEWEDFVRFLTKKCENVVSPMTLHSICSEYTCGSFCFYSNWKDQINEYRNNIPKREDIDHRLKVKMMFGLSVPVDAELLEKFREEAVVEIDTKNRIIKYMANDRSLTLKGDHRHIGKFQSYSNEEKNEEKMISFLVNKCENIVSPLNILYLCEELNKFSGSSMSCSYWVNRIKKYRLKIHEIADLDVPTKVKMMFGLSVPVDTELLEKFRKDAVVEIDTKNRIIKYVANNGSLALKGDHRHGGKFRSYENDEKVDEHLTSFFVKKCDNIVSPLVISNLWKELNKLSRSSMSCSYWINRIKKYRLKIHEIAGVDVSTKVKMMFGLSAPLDLEFIDKLKNYAYFDLDEQNRIIRYDSKVGSLELQGAHSTPLGRKPHVEDTKELSDFIEFVIAKCVTTESPLNFGSVCEEFADMSTKKPYHYWHPKIYSYRERIIRQEGLDFSTRIRILFGLSFSVQPDYIQELRKNAIVEVDNRNRIIRYEAKDGSLCLHGDHSASAKRKSIGVELQSKKRVKSSNMMIERWKNFPLLNVPVKSEITDTFSYEEPEKKNVLVTPEKENTEDKTSQLSVLDALHTLVLCLDSPTFVELRDKIESAMGNANTISKYISSNDILHGFNVCLIEIRKCAKFATSAESIRINLFLQTIKTILISLKIPGLDAFCRQLSADITKYYDMDEKVPVRKVIAALENLLAVFSS
uniref:SPK domain-containing protein n=1 Tax=Caenorhabditis tropicalis TaxID=1561998 RepID=A0A1I7SZ91_9PELO